MASPTEIAIRQLARLIGTPDAPILIDVRIDEDWAADPRLVPGARRVPHQDVAARAAQLRGERVVVICQRGQKLSQGAAAWLRHEGVAAESLEGGFESWRSADAMLIETKRLPERDAAGRTVWVTRERPKIDRIACPWLIRRFVDPTAVFLFVKPAEVREVASRFDATPFDVEDVFWSHRGEKCSFDTMLDELGLHDDSLAKLAAIVRGADTARHELAPEAAGLLAVSLGLSRMFRDDNAQLDAGMVLYDALYRYCRDARDETHNWPTNATQPA